MATMNDRTLAAAMPAMAKGLQARTVTLDRAAAVVDEATRTIEVCFSSEALVDRGGFYEVLSHDAGAIRRARLDNGLAVLVNHDPNDHVGISQDWTLAEDRRCRARLRFGQSARAEEIFRDMATLIRPMVSVRYVVHDWTEEMAPDGRPIFRVTDWEPMEISVASIPADIMAGVGRSAEINQAPEGLNVKGRRMENEINAGAPAVTVTGGPDNGGQAERARAAEILALGKRHGMDEMAMRAVVSGTALDEFRRDVLENLGKITPVTTSPEIGLSQREVKRYSLLRAINALAAPGNAAAQDRAGFELECSAAAQKVAGRQARGIMVPHDVLMAERSMTVGTAAAGGYLKGTDLHPESFIEALRNRSCVMRAGAMEMGGLVGDVAIPRLSAGSTAYWVAEDTAITTSTPTLGQMALTPRVVGAWVDISKKLTVQATPAADAMVMNDMALTIATAIDKAALHGTGTEQPTGITGISGVSVAYTGTDGVAPTYAMLVGVESALAAANGDANRVAWITNPKVRGKLRQIFTNATYGSIPLYTSGQDPNVGDILGYPAYITNQVLSNVTRGNASNTSWAFLGNWADLVVGMWTGLDLTIDPYTLSTTGQLRIVALQLCDINLRQAGSMACLGGIVTT